MRRAEFASTDMQEFDEISRNVMVGQLGLVDVNGYPRVIPINFATQNTTVYFHGAREGEKFELLQQQPKAAFSIDLPLAYIPSYYTSKNFACTATHFFKSIHIRGVGSEVVDQLEKIDALTALMEKYQPEQQYAKINADKSSYRHSISEVGIFKITATEVTIKLKLGQNMSADELQQITEGLKRTNSPIAQLTLKELRKHHIIPE